jgi:hypothetical protein
VGRYIESNNVILLAVDLEVGRVVAVMAIEDKEAINPGCSSSSMLIKMLNPFKAPLVGGPTILRCAIAQSFGNRLFSYQEER